LTIGFGALGLIWGFILKFIPAEHWIKVGAGSKPLSVNDLNKLNTLSIRKNHDSGFYQKHSAVVKRSSVIEERKA
jgi:hypothetical protein